MSGEIIKVIDSLCDKLGIAIDWTSQNIMSQIMGFIERYGSYLIATTVYKLVITIVLCIVSTIVFVRTAKAHINKSKWTLDDYGYTSTLCAVLYPFSALFAVLFLAISLASIGELIQLYYVPEVAILNEIKSLIGA